MASPVDSALIASQAYKPRKAPADGRTKPAAGDAGADQRAAAAGRSGQPAVAVSLSAEALALLSGNRTNGQPGTPRHAEDRITQAEAGEEVEDAAFEPLLEEPPRRREAPFAHVARADTQRYVLPGSRLDIKV